jgi:hypothetical protein
MMADQVALTLTTEEAEELDKTLRRKMRGSWRRYYLREAVRAKLAPRKAPMTDQIEELDVVSIKGTVLEVFGDEHALIELNDGPGNAGTIIMPLRLCTLEWKCPQKEET